MLLSQDLIGYDPALPGGGDPQPYKYLTEVFLPLLRAAGVNGETLRTITSGDPWRVWRSVNDPADAERNGMLGIGGLQHLAQRPEDPRAPRACVRADFAES